MMTGSRTPIIIRVRSAKIFLCGGFCPLLPQLDYFLGLLFRQFLAVLLDDLFT